MGVAPILVVFGAIYHWFPKITGRMMNDTLGHLHFWITLIGTYVIFFPMHYLGVLGMPRRYYAYQDYEFIPQSAHDLNTFISVVALVIAVAQLIFIYNMFWSAFMGRVADKNPWKATTLEWQTPENPPGHGNWGPQIPVVYRWAYDYNVPGAPQDYLPQNYPTPDRVSEASPQGAPTGEGAHA
jgi:cytochrome c oxidase subunit I